MNINISSSSSSSSDEDILELLPNIRYLRPRKDLFNYYTDDEFKKRFRLSKECVADILPSFENELLKESNRNNPITPMNQLLGTLRFYATGSFQQVIGDVLDVHKSSVCRFVHKVSHYIALLAPDHIYIPQTNAEIIAAKDDFYKIADFPGVIGAIDCTHIPIKSPGGNNGELYRNRKGWFSINVQIVCDANLKIRDIVARWPGSVQDNTIFANSLLRARLETNTFPNCWLLGDSGYMCRNYLLTPLDNPQSPAQERYQDAHIRTRNVIERVNGIWKQRFPALAQGMQINIENIPRIIVATAVLHNIANADRQRNEIDEPIDLPDCEAEPIGNNINARRNYIVDTFFN